MPYKDKEKRLGCWREANKRKYSWLFKYKATLSCERCGFNEHPAAIQFHHRDPHIKPN